jgi:hypothetical protein
MMLLGLLLGTLVTVGCGVTCEDLCDRIADCDQKLGLKAEDNQRDLCMSHCQAPETCAGGKQEWIQCGSQVSCGTQAELMSNLVACSQSCTK